MAMEFKIEFLDVETDYFLFRIRTQSGSTLLITPEELSDQIIDIIRYTQLKFLDIGNRNISKKLKPISGISYKGMSDLFINN